MIGWRFGGQGTGLRVENLVILGVEGLGFGVLRLKFGVGGVKGASDPKPRRQTHATSPRLTSSKTGQMSRERIPDPPRVGKLEARFQFESWSNVSSKRPNWSNVIDTPKRSGGCRGCWSVGVGILRGSLCYSTRALPTETQVESGTSQIKSGTSVNLSNSVT